jgi:hypothetical protein
MLILSTLSPDKKRRLPGIHPSLLEPIGELTATFALLEETLRAHIKLLMFPFDQLEDVIADVVTVELSCRRRVELLQCLFELRSDNEAQKHELRRLCAAALQVEQRRNAITHSYWGVDPKAPRTIRLKTTAKPKGFRHHNEALTAEDVRGIAETIGTLVKSFEDFFEKVGPSDEELTRYYEGQIDRYRKYLARRPRSPRTSGEG